MGIFEQMPAWFHDALDEEFGFTSPRAPGYDTVGAIRAMRDGSAKVFVCMGGNFARATPDTRVTEAAISNTRLTVQISTKLNRSHAITGGGP
jgi:anaerobic selenocysteine-containing dehydrogenase